MKNSNKLDVLRTEDNTPEPNTAPEGVESPRVAQGVDRALHYHRPSTRINSLSSLRKPGRSSARLPTPPNHVVRLAGRKRHKFTEEDRMFFVKLFDYLLTQNPHLGILSKEIVSELVKGVSELVCVQPLSLTHQWLSQAPHHTPASWRSWIFSHIEEIKTLRREVLEQENLSVEFHSSDKSNRRDESDADADDDAEVRLGGVSELKPTDSVSLSSSENESEGRTQDLRNTYLPSEKRALAKYIADMSLAKWDRTKGTVRWKLFAAKVGTFLVGKSPT